MDPEQITVKLKQDFRIGPVLHSWQYWLPIGATITLPSEIANRLIRLKWATPYNPTKEEAEACSTIAGR